jgi:hypothetical protein
MAVGRISGPLLKANLLRQGVDLAFETDLIYLKVTDTDSANHRVGIKTNDPTHTLTVNGTSRTTNLLVDTLADIADISISGTTISTTEDTLQLIPGGTSPVVYQAKLRVDDIEINNNVISSITADTDIELRPNGTGSVEVFSDVTVNGNIFATGDITVNGASITLGDSDTDSITFSADVASNIVPDLDNTYTLGTADKRWADAWVNTVYASTIDTGDLVVDNINLNLRQGKIYYVATNGSDAYSGTHQNDPYASIKFALSQAVSGDTVYIYPGTYTEIFPLTIPVGVSVKGSGIRSVTIQPTAGTIDKDAMLLSGETTVEDLTITGFRFNSIDNTGYAFRFINNLLVTTRSPYIKNITVITRGSVTDPATDPYGFDSNDAGKGALIDGSVANALSKEASMLFHSATFFTPNQETIVATNGVRIEWLNSFTYFADKGIYAYSSAAGFAGSGITRLRINNRTGTFNVGNTLSYYDTDGTTVLASGTIASISGDYVNLTGRQLGFETITDRAGKIVYAQGNAKLSTAEKKFGTASLALDGVGDYVTHPSAPDFAFPSNASRSAKTITINGNAAVSATQSKFGGSSIAFDGTGDYLSIASDTDFAFGTGDWTVEFWAYRTVTQLGTIFNFVPASGSTPIHQINLSSTGVLRYAVSGATVITGSSLTLNTWVHVAVSRASGSTKLFVNGTQSGATYTDTNNYSVDYSLTIGAGTAGVNGYGGYLDDIRISNTARYTTTFTPSTTAFVQDSASKLLIHGDVTISDDIGISTDFTLESWIYRSVSGAQHNILDFRTTNTQNAPALYITNANVLRYYVNGSDRIIGTTVSSGVWHHVALSRSGTSTKLFFNGTQVGSTWTDTTNYIQSPLTIGSRFDGLSGNFNGYIDDVRISKGVARYTANFIAPTEQLTGDLATVLLLHFDGANNSITILDDGITRQDIRTNAGGTASIIDFADYSDFGAEIRSIGSAAVYGNYGVYGDGPGVIAYLISQNFAYIGSGKLSTNDPNDRIAANEAVELNDAKIYYTSVDNEGNFKVGDFFYVNQQTGEVLFNGESLSVTTVSGVVFDDGTNVTTVLPGEITTGNIRISDNTIESLSGDINITAASNEINLQNDTYITGNLEVTGDVNIGGNITIGDASTDTISFVAGITSNLTPATTETYDLGTDLLRWNNAYLSRAEIDGLVIDNNTIATTLGNDNLILTANGAGIIYIPNNDVEIDQNLTVTQDLTVTTGTTYLQSVEVTGTITQTGDIDQTGNFTTTGDIEVTGNILATGYLQLNEILVSNNVISTRVSGTDLELRANGTGDVVFEGLKVTDNNVQSTALNANITLTPQGSGNVVINSNQSIVIPVGTTEERPTVPENGMIRYNISTARYEGYSGTNWTKLGGIESVDGRTRILPEASPGLGDNKLYFYANDVLTATIDDEKLYTIDFQTSNLDITSNSITALGTNTDINLIPSGSGAVVFGDLRFSGGTISNTVSNSVTEITQSGTGYVKVAGSYGVVIPSGTNLTRPNLAFTELGMIRFNTENQFVEVFNGVSWSSVAGTSSGVTFNDATDIGIAISLTVG